MLSLLDSPGATSALYGILSFILLGAGKYGLSRIRLMYDQSRLLEKQDAVERHKEVMDGQAVLHASDDRIEAHVVLTNGRVTELERQFGTFRERLSHDEGQIEVLLRKEGGHPI